MSCFLELSLPFKAAPLSAKNDEYRVTSSSANALAFSILENSNDRPIRKGEADIDPDLQRLETKLDLVIQMLNRMLGHDSSIPETCTIKLGANELAWRLPEARPGARFMVELYPSELNSIPIKSIVSCVRVDSGWCYASLDSLDEEQLNIWEKWIFRLHRRAIALGKSKTNSGAFLG